MPHTFRHLHMFGHPQQSHMFKHPHMSPMLPCASVCSGGYLHVVWGCGSPPSVLTSPHVFGCLPMCPTPPTHLYAPLHVSMF